ncbi:MAG: hypothetical protein LIR46_08505 [Bacteroidota bacterium]|nr:hypothetical protein [Bacteroidota bacterium]
MKPILGYEGAYVMKMPRRGYTRITADEVRGCVIRRNNDVPTGTACIIIK